VDKLAAGAWSWKISVPGAEKKSNNIFVVK
jgi:hypothetical protein